MDKKSLRKVMRARRQNMDPGNKKALDKKIRNAFFSSKEYKNSKVIFSYVNTDEELNTIEIIMHALKDGKRIAVPKVVSATSMEALEIYSLEDLISFGPYGILEPKSDAKVISDEVDLCIVPGLAFDDEGNRLGYGGGYYDRFFKKHPNSYKISLCYSYQTVTNVYTDEYDVSVDMIISDNQINQINQ